MFISTALVAAAAATADEAKANVPETCSPGALVEPPTVISREPCHGNCLADKFVESLRPLLSRNGDPLCTETKFTKVAPPTLTQASEIQWMVDGVVNTAAYFPDLHRPKKTLNVDSPSFTPTAMATNSTAGTTMSSRAASAAPFTPRGVSSGKRSHVVLVQRLWLIDTGTATPNLQVEEPVAFNPAQIREFTPQNYDLTNSVSIFLFVYVDS
jgi:hypothetical protein